MDQFLGNSIVFSRSDELWAKKRKHMSAAFYKEKMNVLISTFIRLTVQSLNKLKADQIKNKESFDLTIFISDLIMESILQCVFG